MIFTRLKLNNIYSFSDAEINLSYPRRLANSPLDDETLFGRPKFYYRKVCIITGSNASGKTSFGRILWGIQRFLSRKMLEADAFCLGNKSKPASFEADFATEDFQHHRIYLNFSLDESNAFIINEIKYASVFIDDNDSCNKTTKILDEIFDNGEGSKTEKYYHGYAHNGESSSIEYFKRYKFRGGWNYLLSENKEEVSELSDLKRDILEKIMKTFDPSIKSVFEMKEINGEDGSEISNGFSIRFMNDDNVIVTKSGKVANSERLSRGTFEAVELAHFISSVYDDYYNERYKSICMIYFLDERMAYVHSELERVIITLIISKLDVNSQFFYTTHNSDIFKLDLPVHSYVFIKKENDNSSFIDASSELKKNDRSLSKYVENDVFNTLPDMTLIEDLF